MRKAIPCCLLFVVLLYADPPHEWLFLKLGADTTWQEAIGILTTKDTSMMVLDAPGDTGEVIVESYDPADTNICPMSAFGLDSDGMKKARRRYPLITLTDRYAKIVYNVNTGASGWVNVDESKIALFTDTVAFRGKEVIYLATIGTDSCDSVVYYDSPDGKPIEWKKIMPFTPKKLDEESMPDNVKIDKNERITARGYLYYRPDLRLGMLVNIKGNWAQTGYYDYAKDIEKPKVIPKGWIPIRDKNRKLLVWFVDMVRD